MPVRVYLFGHPLRACIVGGAGAMTILFLTLFAATPVSAQAMGAQLQAGLGMLPGFGVQAGSVSQRRFYNVEALLYVHYRPELIGGGHDWLIAGGFGGSFRIMGAVGFFLDEPQGYEVDLGLRLGPGLQFKPNETLADRNRRFYLFVEPLIRYAIHLEGGRTLFAEAGVQQPFLRLGMWFHL